MVNPAFAATIKLGGDNGELGFFPPSITVSKGETVEFVNNKAFPHNVVFDEDNVPAGVDADKISHEDYLNGPGEKVTNKFDVAGTYGYYCEPHQARACKARSSSTKSINSFSTLVVCDERGRASDDDDDDDESFHFSSLLLVALKLLY